MFLRRATNQGRRLFSATSTRAFSIAPTTRPSSKVAGGVASAFVAAACLVAAGTREDKQSHAGWFKKTNYTKIKNEIIEAIEKVDEKRENGTSIGPTLIRLAWHAAGTYSIHSKTGGSNGAHMRFEPESAWGCNAGLGESREFMYAIHKKHSDISIADLWTLAAVAAIEKMGGPEIPWRPGRKDAKGPTQEPDGRLPNADSGCPNANIGHIRDIFGRLGFNDRETVALCGAHALGRCHTDASGYWGPWTNAETTFSNEYFRLLLEEKWTVKKTHEGKPWTGPMQFENPDGNLMMLPSDIALTQDESFKKYVSMYAKDEELFFRDFSAAFSKLMELGVEF